MSVFLNVSSELEGANMKIFYIYLPVLVSWGCHNKIPHTRQLKQQKFIFSQLWRPESKINVLVGLVSPEASLTGLQTAGFSLSPHMAFGLHAFILRVFSLYKDNSLLH